MKIFYDWEFLADAKTIEAISVGMVAEDGRELYLIDEAIEQEPLYGRICKDRWLMENVVPHLPLRVDRNERKSIGQHQSGTWYFNLDAKDNRVVSRRYIRNAVREFIAATPEPELWAWYGAYDHVAYAQLFGRMIDLPEGFPMWTNDLQQEIVRAGNPELSKQAGGEHHALADARQVMIWWREITPAVSAADTLGLFQLHGAVIAADQLAKMTSELLLELDLTDDAVIHTLGTILVDKLGGLGEAVSRWRERYAPLVSQYPRDLVPEPPAAERETPERREERALWTRDIARMLREQTEVAPELRAGIVWAANWLDPRTAVTLQVGDRVVGQQDVPTKLFEVTVKDELEFPVNQDHGEPERSTMVAIHVEDEPDIDGADAPGALEREP